MENLIDMVSVLFFKFKIFVVNGLTLRHAVTESETPGSLAAEGRGHTHTRKAVRGGGGGGVVLATDDCMSQRSPTVEGEREVAIGR